VAHDWVDGTGARHEREPPSIHILMRRTAILDPSATAPDRAAADGSADQPTVDLHVHHPPPPDPASEATGVRRVPFGRPGAPVFTRALLVIIIVVAISQLSVGTISFQEAGLMKDAVRGGEHWRLFTAPLLHHDPLHLLFNGLALLVLGSLVERLGHRAYVPLVFLVAALAGGIGSTLMSPNPSIGASGGIMGLMGFALAMSYRRRRFLPPTLTRDLLTNIVWVAVMGFAAYRYIDNSAHAAGLAAGVALGLLLVPRGGMTPYWEPGPATRAAGWVAMGIIILSALQAIGAMHPWL
jgi:membrane associated rhomboid family serine protease